MNSMRFCEHCDRAFAHSSNQVDDVPEDHNCTQCGGPAFVALTPQQIKAFRYACQSNGDLATALQEHHVPYDTRAGVKACLAVLGKNSYYAFMEYFLHVKLVSLTPPLPPLSMDAPFRSRSSPPPMERSTVAPDVEKYCRLCWPDGEGEPTESFYHKNECGAIQNDICGFCDQQIPYGEACPCHA